MTGTSRSSIALQTSVGANLVAMPDYLKGYSTGGVLMPLHWLDLFETRDGKPHLLQTGMAHFVYNMTGEVPKPADLWDRFRALPALTQQRFLRQVYFNELRAAGDDQNTPDAEGRRRNGGYQRGYTAIEALSPVRHGTAISRSVVRPSGPWPAAASRR